jgi:type II secretory ATPase GspE/PulE/Tfp pilus assembly ATPase PilB-like protein
VFSTLHTNDAPSATTRLLDMGVEPFLVASTVEGIMAQRLVRRVCAECGQAYEPDKADLPVGFEMKKGETLVKGAGCRACRNTGYRGRVGVYELLRVTEAIREMVMERVNAPKIAATALKDGDLTTLRQDGWAKVRAGMTTVEEVMGALTA